MIKANDNKIEYSDDSCKVFLMYSIDNDKLVVDVNIDSIDKVKVSVGLYSIINRERKMISREDLNISKKVYFDIPCNARTNLLYLYINDIRITKRLDIKEYRKAIEFPKVEKKGRRYIKIPRSIKATLPLEVEVDKRVKDYFKHNYGAPFIIAFMVLLISAAIYLAYNNKAMADQLAVYAYYMLVIGVIGQIIAYIRNRDRREIEYGI